MLDELCYSSHVPRRCVCPQSVLWRRRWGHKHRAQQNTAATPVSPSGKRQAARTHGLPSQREGSDGGYRVLAERWQPGLSPFICATSPSGLGSTNQPWFGGHEPLLGSEQGDVLFDAEEKSKLGTHRVPGRDGAHAPENHAVVTRDAVIPPQSHRHLHSPHRVHISPVNGCRNTLTQQQGDRWMGSMEHPRALPCAANPRELFPDVAQGSAAGCEGKHGAAVRSSDRCHSAAGL